MKMLTGFMRTVQYALVFVLSGCATISSVQRVQKEAAVATRGEVSEAARVTMLEKQLASMQADVTSKLAAIHSQELDLTSATAAAQLESRTAIEEVHRAEQVWSKTLVSESNEPTDDNGAALVNHLYLKLVTKARAQAHHAYIQPVVAPSVLLHFGKQAYSKLIWNGVVPDWHLASRFALAFQPVGYLYRQSVSTYVVRGKHVEKLAFAPTSFGIQSAAAHHLPHILPIAGINLAYAFNEGHPADEFLSLLGASYFRAVGRSQWWGLSARGLAVNTAVANLKEEFPSFSSVWIFVPPANAHSLTVLAQLDGPSVTGAYRFLITPGHVTRVRVTAVIFLRHHVQRLGLAPLTSMFLQGRISPKRVDLLHPSIHDSDGLSIEMSDGHWIWHPLTNPDWLRVTDFKLDNPMGYGLMQRDRDFNQYQSLGNHYQDRPSAWVTFLGHWGPGQFDLIEIPSHSASNDNIVAFWEPRVQPKPGEALTLRYDIAWQGKSQTYPSLAWTSETRMVSSGDNVRIFSVYFSGGELADLPSWIAPQPEVRAAGYQNVTDVTLVKLPTGGRWRLRFTVHGAAGKLIKAKIVYRDRPLTETWTYGA